MHPYGTRFETLDSLFRAIIAVPKTEIDRRERQFKRKQDKNWTKKSEMTATGRIILFVAVFLSLPFHGSALDTQYSRRSLSGIKSFSVVEDLSKSALDLGLSPQQLQTAVELKLRLAGIKVVGNEASVDLPGSPYLYVNIITVGKAPGIIGYAIILSFNQAASLERNPDIKSQAAATWSIESITTVGSDRAAESVKSSLGEMVDKFLNAYLSVNPK
jgi:hypothetical protein